MSRPLGTGANLKAQLVGLRYKSVFALFAGNAAGMEPVRHLMTGAMGSFPGCHRGSDRTQPADVDKRRPAASSMRACCSRTNADDRLPVDPLGLVYGGDGIVEGPAV